MDMVPEFGLGNCWFESSHVCAGSNPVMAKSFVQFDVYIFQSTQVEFYGGGLAIKGATPH